MSNAPSGSDCPSNRLTGYFPPLERNDRIALVKNLTEGSRWNINFGVMLGCSVLIAGLGLLQDSVAVIIGAMLVAPLMTPLLGIGLALVQGNYTLLFEAIHSMWRGSLLSLCLGIGLRLITPGQELTLQVTSRGTPNLLDLAIAFLAGVAAGYALVRPKLSGALPGVAISVALVPPLAASGIALGSGDWLISVGALLLCLINMVAIVLGSSLVFWIHHISAYEKLSKNNATRRRMRRIIIGLGLAVVLCFAPLTYRLIAQIKVGQTKPESFAIPEELWFKLHNHLETIEGVDFLTATRSSTHREEDVYVVITADRPVPRTLIEELDAFIDSEINQDIKVKFSILQQAPLMEDHIGPLPAESLNETTTTTINN